MNLHEIKVTNSHIVWVAENRACGPTCRHQNNPQNNTNYHAKCLEPLLGDNRWCYCEDCWTALRQEHYVPRKTLTNGTFLNICDDCFAGNHPQP